MFRRFAHRLTTVMFMVMSLLFAQLAMAGYVCPEQADVAQMAATMTDGVPCDGMDAEQPALCHQHAADPGKTFEALKLPGVVPPVVVQVLELPLQLQALAAQAVPPTAVFEAQPPPDPVFLTTLRLRD